MTVTVTMWKTEDGVKTASNTTTTTTVIQTQWRLGALPFRFFPYEWIIHTHTQMQALQILLHDLLLVLRESMRGWWNPSLLHVILNKLFNILYLIFPMFRILIICTVWVTGDIKLKIYVQHLKHNLSNIFYYIVFGAILFNYCIIFYWIDIEAQVLLIWSPTFEHLNCF